MKSRVIVLFAAVLIWASPAAAAKNFPLQGTNEVCGGIGFSAGVATWTPGGFKWFNDYSRMLSELFWLNFQFNVVTGGNAGCWYDHKGGKHCGGGRWGGNALQFVAGVKLKWRLKKVPLQFHAKVGGNFDVLLLWSDYTGVAFGGRGGFGARYFFTPKFGAGLEILGTFGPAFINRDVGVKFYGTIDMNVGIEYRF